MNRFLPMAAAALALVLVPACQHSAEDTEAGGTPSGGVGSPPAPAAGAARPGEPSGGSAAPSAAPAPAAAKTPAAAPAPKADTKPAPAPAPDARPATATAPEETSDTWPRGRAPVPKTRTMNRVAFHDAITIVPAHPVEGEAIEVRAGPVMFPNSCGGVTNVQVVHKVMSIRIAWDKAKPPPHTMCAMVVTYVPVIAEIPGLEAGSYSLNVDHVGARTFRVLPKKK